MQAVYKVAQLEGIVPLSGTKNEEHMQQDVAVESVPLQGEAVRGFIRLEYFQYCTIMTSLIFLSDPGCPEGAYHYLKGEIATGLSPIVIVCSGQFGHVMPG